ncbi:MAG: histidine phosphatase family protein [Caldilineaceae bacterium]|nr:histidine phosphatase family protein [Caldilineaceae bacterium]
MRLFIIRHGESHNNWIDGKLSYEEYIEQRLPDPPLTELGQRQAAAVATHLAQAQVAEHFRDGLESRSAGYGITKLYCSPMLRAMQTAWPIAQALDMPAEVMMDIFEQGGMFSGDPRRTEEVVNYPGLTRAEIEERFNGYILPPQISPDGWWRDGYEDMPGCFGRAARVAYRLRQMARQMADDGGEEERIVLVSHATFIDTLLKALLNQLPGMDHVFVHYNTAITRIDFRGERQYLRYINRTEHFTPDLFSEYHPSV